MSNPTNEEIRKSNEKKASETMERVLHLLSNPDFEWFIQQAVQAEMDLEETILHNCQKTDIERRDSLMRWTAFNMVRFYAKDTRDAAGKTLGHAPAKTS